MRLRSRLAVVATHPIQYQAPWFRALSAHPDVDLEVLYCYRSTSLDQARAGFGVEFEWDVPLLDGYAYRFLNNVAQHPGWGRFDGLDTPDLGRMIRQRQYDAVLVNGWFYKSAWQALFACWRTGTPTLVRSDSHLHSPRGRLKSWLKEPVYRAFISRFDACLAVGRWSREYFLHYGALARRIFVVPHVIDTHRFTARAAQAGGTVGRVREQWGLRQGSATFLFVGKFLRKKRPMDFVRAIEIADQREPRVELAGLMVGDGPQRSECEAYARARRLPIHFAGFLNQSEIAAAYAASDAIVLPSGGETWGLVVNEAMALGLPSVVSDAVGCGPDLVTPGVTGEVYPVGDAEALGGVLVRLAAAPSTMRAMGQQARALAQAYVPESAAAATVRAVSAVATGAA